MPDGIGDHHIPATPAAASPMFLHAAATAAQTAIRQEIQPLTPAQRVLVLDDLAQWIATEIGQERAARRSAVELAMPP